MLCIYHTYICNLRVDDHHATAALPRQRRPADARGGGGIRWRGGGGGALE